MAEGAIPAPGGGVSLKRFAIYTCGGVVGWIAFNALVPREKLPAWVTQDFFGQVSLDDVLMIASILMGAGLAGKLI